MSVPMRGRLGEIRARLLDLIDSVPEGSRLPPERALSEEWHVARMTLRRAMDELVDEGLIVRRHGSGTFTRRPKVVRQMVMRSFSQEMLRRGMTPGSRTIDVRRHSADRRLSKQLRIPVGDPVVSFIRLRLADGEPMAVERTSTCDYYVPGLRDADLDGSWYDVLATKYGVRLVGGVSRLEPAMPDPRSAEWLGIPVSQPCLTVRGRSFDDRGRVVELVTAVYRGDRYSLTFELRPPPPHSSSKWSTSVQDGVSRGR